MCVNITWGQEKQELGMGPNLLRQTLLEMGMIEFDDSVHSESQWSLWWKGCRFKEEELHSLKETQRVNHHPAPLGRQADIIQKDGLLRAIRRIEEGQFVATFKQTARNIKKKLSSAKRPFNHECGEDDKSILLTDSHWLSSSTTTSEDAGNEYTNIWILKPADQSRGKGIFLFDKLEDLIYLTKSVVQRYITNPLLISGYKFDLRLYAVVPSYAPFIVYIHADGLVRFATERFDLGNLSNVYSHLTNSSINVNGPEYLVNKVN
ncbi:unnamed protein product [Echinostoma caproni]|uniref:Tubulin--tyrosine ligase-like protein 9 n=1 Tax=Echinostoma caproni TaxID=27848 RepID=A0A183A9M4_9TREM|nr:unnamed protein product [Echinostoma caproni]